MKTYKCHKEVKAFKITEIVYCPEDNSFQLFNDESGIFVVSSGWISRNPDCAPGGYLVEYNDGYTSYSPAAAFEAGYSEVR